VAGNAGLRHALICYEHKKDIVTINVEVDVLAGPLLLKRDIKIDQTSSCANTIIAYPWKKFGSSQSLTRRSGA